MMETQTSSRRLWPIDERLAALKGCAVRLRIEGFSTTRWNGAQHSINFKSLSLPDATSLDGDPVYAEGVLKEFVRHVAVVYVELDLLPVSAPANGRISFRGKPAVIFQGPATVQLHSSHFVERIPMTEPAYWDHLLSTNGQMRLPLE